ncbi:MAG: threonine/serine dehydratase [Pseudomonadota bacterium]|nr:threonine/serine dehydratase [Pseudomonadota bacterium]
MAGEGASGVEPGMVSAAGVRRAAERLKGHALVTPLLENESLNERAGGRVLMKAETLQHCGSFKFRGAYNLISQLSPEQQKRGVLAWSSGNHAQGVARAARMFGAPATIVMPADAPAIKAEKVKGYGAEIIRYDRYRDDREAIGRAIAAERGLALVPSYDHIDIIEGQGTLALEAAAQAKEMGASLDVFVVCCGGGGITAGCALALEDVSPQTDVWIAEPENFDEAWASVQAGRRLVADVAKTTICDALASPSPGLLTFPVMQRLVRGGATLTEDEVGAAMAFAFKYLKLVLEPGGAVALAAVLAGKIETKGRTVGLTLSGGNVDAALFAKILARCG